MVNDPADLIQRELGPDERLLWSGAPAAGVRLGAQDFFLIPFSLFWGGFAMLWNAMVWRSNAPISMKLFGLPFLVIGLYLIAGRFFFDAWQRGKICYGLTNQRALIVNLDFNKRLRSYSLSSLPGLELIEHRDGKGSIILEPSIRRGRGSTKAKGFLLINDARTVYEQIRQAAAGKT